MSVIMIILLFMFAINAKVAESGQYFDDYCSPKKSNALKGIFVMMVFVSHFRGYVTLTDADTIAVKVVSFLGQQMVAPFLFYSGYGVVESIKKKGLPYVKKLPVHRALKTLLHFDIAVLFFLLMRFILRKPTTLSTFLLALVGWTSLGNSNWYIFAMVALYLITAISFFLFRKNHYLAAVCVTALSLVLILLLTPYRPNYCYNTILCYVMGVWYSLLREHVEKIVMRNDIIYCLALVFFFMSHHWIGERSQWNDWAYQIYAMLFVVLLVGASMKVSLDNAILQFLGKHTFSIYILQRLPMWFLSSKGVYYDDNVSLFIISFLITCAMAVAFDSAMQKLDNHIFGK